MFLTFLSYMLLFPLPLLQAGAPDLEERARVEYVLIDVVVRDRNQRLVTDLTLEEFVLTEGRKKIALESLDILDLRGEATILAEPEAIRLPSLDVPRTTKLQVILAVDLAFGVRSDAMQSMRRLEEYVQDTDELAGVEYMVYSLEQGGIQSGFSPDPEVTLEALRVLRREHEEHWANSIPPLDLFGLEKRFRECEGWNCIQGELWEFVEQENGRTGTALRELETLVTAFSDPGSLRMLVFVSPGFALIPGRGAMELARNFLPRRADLPPPPPPDPGEIPDGTPADPFLPFPTLRGFGAELQRVVAGCATSRVVFHAFDVFNFGIEEQRLVDASLPKSSGTIHRSYRWYREEHQEGLVNLVEETGGTFWLSLRKLRPVVEGNRFVYVLGYRSPPGKEGAFRKIKVKCRRKGVSLRHRSGYVG